MVKGILVRDRIDSFSLAYICQGEEKVMIWSYVHIKSASTLGYVVEEEEGGGRKTRKEEEEGGGMRTKEVGGGRMGEMVMMVVGT